MAGAARGSTRIKGYVLVKPTDNDDDSDADDNQDDNDWPDYGEMSAMASGGAYVSFSQPMKAKVTIKSLQNDRQYVCEGNLHLIEPWWMITVQTRARGRVHYITGYPFYELRTDKNVQAHKLITLFLSHVGNIGDNVIEATIEQLIQYIEDNGIHKRIGFKDLEETINNFIQSLEDDEREQAHKQVYSMIYQSVEGEAVMFAMKYPKLFKLTSQLLPCQFLKLAGKLKYMSEADLEELEEATESCPWVFGFKQILYKDYGVMGMEAQLRYWINSGLIQNIPPMQKDAIYIYHALKMYAKKRGHTYVNETDLMTKSASFLEKHVVRNWKEALQFLDDNAVIIRETEEDHVKVFLKSIWYAERDTAKAFAAVLDKGFKKPLELDVDLESDHFDQVRGDRDQWTAIQLMCHSPISVLSGKGGCGKTSVVTTLLSHACVRSGPKKSQKEDDLAEEDELDAELCNADLDDSVMTQANKSEISDKGNISLDKTCATQRESAALTKDGNQDTSDTYLSETHLGSQILLTAPTGKAAILLGRKAKLKSCTLHSVIMSFKMHCINKFKQKKEKAKNGNGPDQDAQWVHANKTILVVDECSLVSVNTFSTVMNTLIKECSLKKIILLGDVRQLPSIEPGNFLEDIFRVFTPLGFGQELRTNHRAESELIVQNATRIAVQQNPVFDSSRSFHLLQPEALDQQGRDMVVKRLLKTCNDLKNPATSQFVAFTRKDCEGVNEICCQHYSKHSQKTHKGKLYFVIGDKVCMTKNGIVSHHTERKDEPKNKYEDGDTASKRDDSIAKVDNSVENRKHRKDRNNHARRNLQFVINDINSEDGIDFKTEIEHSNNSQIGDSMTKLKDKKSNETADSIRTISENDENGVIASTASNKNEVNEFMVPPPSEPEKEIDARTPDHQIRKTDVKLCNGEIFFIEREFTIIGVDGKIRTYMSLNDRDPERPRSICVDYRQVMRQCKMRHAWVRTIHTFQGSESQSVVYILGNVIFENWQHVYTAITRGRQSVFVVGSPFTLNKTITRKVFPRMTTLRTKLEDHLRPRENMVKTCIEKVSECLRKEQAGKQNDNTFSPSMFDSDDSWMCNVSDQPLLGLHDSIDFPGSPWSPQFTQSCLPREPSPSNSGMNTNGESITSADAKLLETLAALDPSEPVIDPGSPSISEYSSESDQSYLPSESQPSTSVESIQFSKNRNFNNYRSEFSSPECVKSSTTRIKDKCSIAEVPEKYSTKESSTSVKNKQQNQNVNHHRSEFSSPESVRSLFDSKSSSSDTNSRSESVSPSSACSSKRTLTWDESVFMSPSKTHKASTAITPTLNFMNLACDFDSEDDFE